MIAFRSTGTRWFAPARSRSETCPPARFRLYCHRFDPTYYEKLDPGEAESLALLEQDAEARICSADKIVWRVLGSTNQADRGVSLEEILRQIGQTKNLPDRFSRAFREKWSKSGGIDRFMGRGDTSCQF